MKTISTKPGTVRGTKWNMPLVAGSIMVTICLLWLARTTWFVGHATRVSGQVIEVVWKDNPIGEGTIEYAVFTFSDASGIVHTQTSDTGWGFHLRAGDKATILYDATRPEHSDIDSFQTIWFVQSYFLTFGLLFLGFGGVFWYFTSHPEPNMQMNRLGIVVVIIFGAQSWLTCFFYRSRMDSHFAWADSNLFVFGSPLLLGFVAVACFLFLTMPKKRKSTLLAVSGIGASMASFFGTVIAFLLYAP